MLDILMLPNSSEAPEYYQIIQQKLPFLFPGVVIEVNGLACTEIVSDVFSKGCQFTFV